MSRLARLPATTIIAAALALGGCQSEQDVNSLVAQAAAYQKKGELNAAIIQLKNAVQLDPGNGDVRMRLGNVYLEHGDAVSAEKELRRAADLRQDGATLQLARALLLQGKFQEVLDEFTLQAGPGESPEALALRGNALLGLQRNDEARSMFERALAADSALPAAALGLARLEVAAQRMEDARALLERALAQHPDDVECLRFKAELLRADNKTDEAMAVYHHLIKVRPGYGPARVDLASMLVDAGKFDEARKQLQIARKGSTATLGLFHTQALLDYREGKFNAAREGLQQLLSVAPEHYPSVLLAGAVEYKLNAIQPAELHVAKFLSAYPRDLFANKLMANVKLRQNQPGQALALAEALVDEHGDDPELLAIAGEAAMRSRQFSRATEYFEKASALAPRAGSLYTAAALVHLRSGDTARAAEQLERSASSGGDTMRTKMLLVVTYLRGGQTDKALATVGEMEKQANSPAVQNLKGGVYLARQDFVKARDSFASALKLDPLHMPALDNLAQLDLLEKRPEQARARYRKALESAPRNALLMEALARLETRLGNVAGATGWLEKAYQDNPDDLRLGLRLADYYTGAGNKERALTLAHKLQSSNPTHPDALNMLARTQAASGDVRAAADTYGKLAATMPGAVAPLMNQARAQLAAQDNAGALDTVRRIIKSRPNSIEAHRLNVALLLLQKRHAEALRAARDVQKQFPTGAIGFRLEGDVLTAQGKQLDALRLYERAFALQPSGAGMVLLHTTLSGIGKQAEADKRIDEWLRKNDKDIPTRMYLAGHKLTKGDYKAAAAPLEQVLLLDPDNVVALNDLAWALHHMGDKRALGYAERAYKLAPRSPVVMDTLGWIHAAGGDTGKALPLIRQASQLAPDSNSVRYHLGVLLGRSGDKAAARRELERVAADRSDAGRAERARDALRSL
ncbi:XrtA/PEP-CTERM system TPR-repeat protein PrsT [Pseudoduganella sp. GCM10020061]|uniref:XrtA/PEP-CTERM system TPR-repeat protein PrsT n=1 Tax=Pseudoduganella sp. GCM10020061 TaxID=3317345 RepID=UPI0036288A79